MIDWYFVIGFIASIVAVVAINTARFLQNHRISISKIDSAGAASSPNVSAAQNELSGPATMPSAQQATESFSEPSSSDDSAVPLEVSAAPSTEIPVATPLDMAAFGRRLTRSKDPIAELKDFVDKTRNQEAKIEVFEFQTSGKAEPYDSAHESAATSDLVAPDNLSLYLCRALEEAGLFDEDAKFGSLTAVRPGRSRTFYLRVNDDSIAWGDMLRIYAIEGALNRTLFAWEHFICNAETPEVCPSQDEIYRFNQALASSITAQLGSDPISRASMSDVLGEWGVRQALASGIESFRLPLRLTANFRLNLMAGDCAIVANFVPAKAHPASVYSAELERVIDCTSMMRDRAASDYAMRCALLLAGHAFRCSKRLCHVFVAVVMDTPLHHVCVLSGDISREPLREYDLSNSFDAAQVCQELGVLFELKDGALGEVEQGFSLDSERFCPRSRYESVDLSERILPEFEAELLGAAKVRDLAINENAHRDRVAQQVAAMLTGSTTKDVHRVLELTQNDKDPSVQDAGERLALRLIEGAVQSSDSLAVMQEFVFGDALTQSCERALKLLENDEASSAAEVLTDVLAPLDALDVYADTPKIAWREFSSYVGRALYNRMFAQEGVEVCLVPDSYYSAQLLQSSAQIELGNYELALSFARRAQDLNPFDMSPLLRTARSYELMGNLEQASVEISRYLERAFDPNAIGTCYYRLAFLHWHMGNIKLADACYQKALSMRSPGAMPAAIELQMMRIMHNSKPVGADDVERIITDANIALAPTEEVVNILIEAAQAATDAEVFPVARSFATLLGSLSGDDVMHGIASSIELDPDW